MKKPAPAKEEKSPRSWMNEVQKNSGKSNHGIGKGDASMKIHRRKSV